MGVYIYAEPDISPIIHGDNQIKKRYRLSKDWLVRTPYGDFTVPKGMITDGASIPRFLWRICGSPFDSPRIVAAIIHDHLYSTHHRDRKTADIIYRDMQLSLGIPAWKAYIEYWALRRFGKAAWRNGAIEG